MRLPDFMFTVTAKGTKQTVRFLDMNADEVGNLQGSFTSQEEAVKAFQAFAGQAYISLVDQREFSRNVRSLAQYKRYDREREVRKAKQL